MPPPLRGGHGAVYSLPFGALLRSDFHAYGRQPAHTVPGSLLSIIVYATVFIIADMGIISHFYEKCNRFAKYFYEAAVSDFFPMRDICLCAITRP